jgi:hypothetical protein
VLILAALLLVVVVVAVRWLGGAAVLRRKHSTSKVVWSDFRAEKLGHYYFPNSVSPGDFAELDDRGVRVINFEKKPTIGKRGRQYVLSAINQYGLGSWDLWLDTKDSRHLEAATKQADWLVENQTVDDRGVGVWLHRYDLGGEHQVRGPWASSLAQGISISLLTRMHQETGSDPYREAAARALRSFATTIEEGGVRAPDGAGGAFYEEVPSSPPTHILNGHVYALLGIHDYFRVTGSGDARDLFESGLEALRGSLSRYDTGYWSRYSLSGRRTLTNHFTLASPLYHRLHIDMLRVVHAITGDRRLEKFANRWESYLGGPFDLAIRIGYAAFQDVVLVVKPLTSRRPDSPGFGVDRARRG